MRRIIIWKLVTIILVLLLQGYTSTCCTKTERSALLQLKSFFISVTPPEIRDVVWRTRSSQLRSWDDHSNKSCCSWERVECNQLHPQRVTALSLDRVMMFSIVEPFALNVTLFKPFEKLTSLNLFENWIQQLVGSEGSLNSLEELDLVANVFVGSFPAQVLANSKQLRVLKLSFNSLNGSIQDQGLCDFRNLQQLYLGNNDLSGSLPPCLEYFTSLQVLDLSNNSLNGEVSSIVSNLTSLKSLSLSQNHFQGEVFLNGFLNHSNLENLSLSSSGLQVRIDDTLLPLASQLKSLELSACSLHMQSRTLEQFLLHQHKLTLLDISHNGVAGAFPTWILHNNTRIQTLILRNNSFEGILILPVDAKIESLTYLDLSKNQISGHFPDNIGSIMPQLLYFNASRNFFYGQIPTSIGNMTKLHCLDFSHNKLFGEIPSSMFAKCASLTVVMLSNNSLQGDIIPESMNLTGISELYLDNNHFNGTIRHTLLKSARLGAFDLSNNEVAGCIPSWIGNLSSLTVLLMPNNQLHGHIPSELFHLQELQVLDLSNNGLDGVMPSSYNFSMIQVLSLRNNVLTGPLPVGLSGSSHLITLDLSENKFSGFILPWIGNLSKLNVLLLGQNRLEGEFPVKLCQLNYINILDVSNNNISGAIPSCLANMSFGNTSTVFDISYFETLRLLMSFVTPIDFLPYLASMLGLRIDGQEEVMFLTKSRYDAYGGYILGQMSGLDLSCNQLSSRIPQELGQLGNIRALNLSHNRLSGSIPYSFSMLSNVESLDLSYNKLSGEIPSQLAEVHNLGTFNVSYNNLSGQVPETGQFATFGENSYMGNPFLHGFLKPRSATPSKNDTKETNDNTVEGFDWEVFLWSFGMSSVTIWLACLGVLWINPYWRRAWFQFLDYHVIWWLY